MTKVTLEWVTPNGDRLVGRMARVSNPANQNNPNVSKLIRYLIEHKHWSPFEMVCMCVQIDTTRDIGRQILRHRSFHFQETSQRYQDVGTVGFQAPLRECRLQDFTNRQNSLPNENEHLAEWWSDAQNYIIDLAKLTYREALAKGIAKEQARAVLPEGLTPSRLYMQGTLRDWLHYIDLRADPATQKEHRHIAEQCRDLVYQHFPDCAAAMWGDRKEDEP